MPTKHRDSPTIKALHNLAAVVCATVLTVWPIIAVPSDKPSITVVYPDIREPYRGVFRQIIDGVNDGANARVDTHIVQRDKNVSKLSKQLNKHDTKLIIALGAQALTAAKAAADLPIVVGAVLKQPAEQPDNLSGITMLPDPSLLFARLKELRPNAVRIAVVYNPNVNQELISLARQSAQSHGLQLVAREATNLSTAARTYRELFKTGEIDAIWLPQDRSTVDNKIILPLVLERAWKHDITVFSSSLAHVERGALFALYPDNIAMGRRLTRMALAALEREPSQPGHITPLVDVKIAFNIRTASHLGMHVTAEQKRQFDLIFPIR